MRKRIISILISLAMLLSLSTGFASVAADEIWESGVYGDVTWTYYSSGLLTVQGTGNSKMEDAPGPIFVPWFWVSMGITDVVVTGVSHLMDFAFCGFPGLRTISFDDCIRSIGQGAADGCSSLRTVTFTGDPPALGLWAFPEQGYEIIHPNTRAWTQEVLDRFYSGEPTPVAPSVPCDITAQEVYDIMISLKSEYPEGKYWTNNNSYAWKGRPNEIGYGCAGFAYILSDAAFGEEPATEITGNITIDTLRVGDVLRINNNTHSVVVLEIHDDYIVIAEGNYNSSIHWGRKLTASEVARKTDYVLTRYPEHSWVEASCEAPKSCRFCDTTEGEALGHLLAGGVCSRCGFNESEKPCEHNWVEATCADPKYCSLCNEIEGDPLPHDLLPATCQVPATCAVCGKTQGVASSIHTYDGNTDAECNVCGAERLIAQPIVNDIVISGAERELLRLTNLERLEAGLQPFATFAPLQAVAQVRAREIKSVFDHIRPNGEMFNTALQEGGLSANCGENLGKLQKSPSEVLDNWMNSSSHRENIMNSGFGLMAAAENDLHWVQYFMEGVRYTTMQVLIPERFVYYPGTPISRMSLNAYLTDAEGNVYLIPLDDSYCIGYDTSDFGTQTFTVNLLGFTWEMTLGDPDDVEPEPEPPTDNGKMGDVNDDGKADYSDALFILRASIGLETLTEAQKLLADVNDDGRQDYSDALQILRASIGL